MSATEYRAPGLSLDQRVKAFLDSEITAPVTRGLVIDLVKAVAEARASLASEEPDWEYGVSWLEGADRVFMPTEDDWRARVEIKRMNQGYPYPEENYVVRRSPAGPWVPLEQEGDSA